MDKQSIIKTIQDLVTAEQLLVDNSKKASSKKRNLILGIVDLILEFLLLIINKEKMKD